MSEQSSVLQKTALSQVKFLQKRPALLWTAPLIGFVAAIILRKQVRLGGRQILSLLHGENLKTKQNAQKLARFKKVLFEDIREVVSSDPKLRSEGKIRILELSPGTGTNVEFYPRGSKLISYENDGVFEKYYQEHRHEFPHVQVEKFLKGSPENMSELEDESVDVIIGTLVCCSVEDIALTMREIKRVLAKGGKYYFVEHEQYPDKSWGYSIQKAVNPLWRVCNDGCNVSRRVSEVIEYVGFRAVNQKRYLPAEIPFLIRPLIVGYAVK
ncbi:methyltransferase-like protein 7A [Galendromus occidentalis]|uniref:Methyltransferase-like protein 7A n=1 Tax=Galendromus occidentalis TaxID=34638 RepID=A0AAJ6QQS4_9ACAR|nr:methyltransferase-like protein 7A [Galendromus occidentalis]